MGRTTRWTKLEDTEQAYTFQNATLQILKLSIENEVHDRVKMKRRTEWKNEEQKVK